ncbi:hypothetical protein NDU88_003143 [Pleurodeles waltl]|uniref:t-SNARE coiled-coil homology domain-containing protein n=1 Tax=Pleurodeles waltl TaxID=8319 RepID=A0AAV7W1A4_PLEWA|nr:hypothetical protein NDU88_003143 [Pleurodeles waltl]
MGKPDKTQAKLQFDLRKTSRSSEGHTVDTRAVSGDPDSDGEPGLKQILTTMQQTLATIDGKIDSLNYRIDRMTERLDKHAQRLDEAEGRLSQEEVEDDHTTIATGHSKIDKKLTAMHAKVKDLEARSLRNNTGDEHCRNLHQLSSAIFIWVCYDITG